VQDKMAKDKTWIIILIIVIVLVYGFSQGWLNFDFSTLNYQNTNPFSQNSVPNPSNLQNQYNSYQASLYFNPNIICVGDSSTRHIETNIPNGICIILIKNNGIWNNYKNINLDASGKYSESQFINTVGTSSFITVCCDNQTNCKISNGATLIVNNCV
jgi:hypothetical protein